VMTPVDRIFCKVGGCGAGGGLLAGAAAGAAAAAGAVCAWAVKTTAAAQAASTTRGSEASKDTVIDRLSNGEGERIRGNDARGSRLKRNYGRL
jgi:threonine dehydratase